MTSGERRLLHQTVTIWLLFFYTNIYGLAPETVMPMIIEHLDTDEEYEQSVRYVQQITAESLL